jgi:PAS domain S-box-containing protein
MIHGGSSGLRLEESIPGSRSAPLESILCTEELRLRPFRPPDYETENRALAALASALAESRSNILQTLADTILDVTQCDSSGLSLLTKDDGGKRFYWPAIAGMWKPHIGGGTPRDFGPCGDVLDQNRTLLFQHFERRYPYFEPVTPLVEECLLVPFYVDGRAVGTIWAIMHSDRHKFDAEDERLMSRLGQFASLAYQTLVHIDNLKLQIAAREKAEAEVRELASGLEAKVRCLIDSNIIGIIIWSHDGRITDANETFLRMVGYSRADLVAGQVSWMELTPAEWHSADAQRLAMLKSMGISPPYEKEYFHKAGHRVPVLVGGAAFDEAGDDGAAFVVDLSDRKKAEQAARESEKRYAEVRMELAHANRVATMGELSASITHEVMQPVAAAVNNTSAALRWLGKEPPDLEQARQALNRIFANGNRASEVIGRIRALIKKAPPSKDAVEINEAILEVIALTRGEVLKNDVSVQTQLAEDLPPIQGDRVQLQQVILNLIINAVEAMRCVSEGARELLIRTGKDASGGVLVVVQDSGPGVSPESFDRLFDAFYTTKPSGMGMGLSICRSIIEAHDGRLWAVPHDGPGATFQFTLPIHGEDD